MPHASRVALLLAVLAMSGCQGMIDWQKLMGADNVLIIRTPPGQPPIIIQKEPRYQA